MVSSNYSKFFIHLYLSCRYYVCLEPKTASKNKVVQPLRKNPMDRSETELFIEEVRKRPPLWNFETALQCRTKDAKAKLWTEVIAATELSGRENLSYIICILIK